MPQLTERPSCGRGLKDHAFHLGSPQSCVEVRKHAVNFEEAATVFDDEHALVQPDHQCTQGYPT
jgi:uncharacterized DUF497 family protein